MENKNIYLIVGVFLFGLIIGSLLSGALTGKVSKVNTLSSAKTSIFISPASARAGDIISITVDSRSGGASPVLYIRDIKDDRRESTLWCRGLDDFGNPVSRSGSDEDSSCFSRVTFQYKLLNTYEVGTYYIGVADRESGENARAYFEVVGG